MNDADGSSVLTPLGVGSSDDDFRRVRQLLTPGRLLMLAVIHHHGEITVADLMDCIKIGRRPMEIALTVFLELNLIELSLDPNPGHGKRRTIISKIPAELSELNLQITLRTVLE